MTIAELFSSLGDNPYFGAGFGLAGLGAGAAVLRKGLVVATILFRRHCMISMEVPSKDVSYQWILKWISVRGTKTHHLSVDTSITQNDVGKLTTKYNFIPSPGDHFFRYKKNWIKVERVREQQMTGAHRENPWETVTFIALGNNRSIFFDILEEARMLALDSIEGKLITYVAKGAEWRQFGFPRTPRPLSSVVLEEGVKESIVSDVKEFISNQPWYSARGIPYRRGYLLYGPPGCGKTSFITALAGELQFSICILSLSEIGMTDDRLNYLLSIAPQDSIILLEDVDVAVAGRDMSREDPDRFAGMGSLTFSGLLNALDGVASTEGRIVFMTTNHLERLPPALIRPGRVDMKEKIDFCTKYQLEQMFLRFFPDQNQEEATVFADCVMSHGQDVSAAQIQGYFMFHKNDPKNSN
ncbi:mitochondrial chaperone BCS1 [Lingula anatina]|uniref:Mitochondrial chaperone BCS1 n=1 Tax=Lingula anatina TaxID=7574 RepID=A0A1S3IQB7_LINAN|nr:mitochondrial chaperone BCS1 [Lingula anatina]|eukprot:XP_013400263.1 mitochondrial chaperone BCS1 [Lingula anatina]